MFTKLEEYNVQTRFLISQLILFFTDINVSTTIGSLHQEEYYLHCSPHASKKNYAIRNLV